MTFFETSRRALIAGAASLGMMGGLMGGAGLAQAEQMLDSIHFLIPGGAGGGWDGTARGTGEALTNAGLVGQASYENMSGGGGGKAIGYLIENAESNHGTLMVNSTPIVIRSLTGVFPQNFRDLTLIAGTIGDYAAIIAKADSEFETFSDLVEAFNADPNAVSIGGGSVPGGMDHLVAAMAFEGAGADSAGIKYIPYDAGGEAMNAAILSGEITAGSTGFSEAVELAKAGEMKVLAITAPERVDALPDAPTLKELGYRRRVRQLARFLRSPRSAGGTGTGLSRHARRHVRHARVGRGPRPQRLGQHPQFRRRVPELPRDPGTADRRSHEEARLPLIHAWISLTLGRHVLGAGSRRRPAPSHVTP